MRRKIPSDVARQLRQEAGFGCCKCGFPLIQYHHIVEWADDQHFRVADMMVLCPNHHDQATKGAMPEPQQRLLKVNPYNTRSATKGATQCLSAWRNSPDPRMAILYPVRASR